MENLSTEHHLGEYIGTRTTITPDEEDDINVDVSMSPRTIHLKVIERRLQLMKLMSEDSEASLISEIDEEQLRNTLRPISRSLLDISDDPFLDCEPSPLEQVNETHWLTSQCNEENYFDSDSWTTDSDADSWDEDLDQNNDDASNDVSFSSDSRFIDSGWGGECLRETEDIDFEFVYALHTFVATVEGQANATKGDTMVLLDDSNSYWWLVRVSKDNSIGTFPTAKVPCLADQSRLSTRGAHRNTHGASRSPQQA